MRTELSIAIDWADLDLFGHVNNVVFFRYMQASRLRYCETLGLTSLNEAGKLSFLVASCKCDFRKALYYPGAVSVQTEAVWAKNTSFCLRHLIYDKDHELAAEGEDILVLYDYTREEKMQADAKLRKKMGLLV